jgi:hypothetical protein
MSFWHNRHIDDVVDQLPSAHKILLNPKKNWKPITHIKIDNFWKNKWPEEAKTKSTLSYMETDTWLVFSQDIKLILPDDYFLLSTVYRI